MENKREHILVNQRAYRMAFMMFRLCIGKEGKSLINEDKQEALPKLSSQTLFGHVVQVEGSGKKQFSDLPSANTMFPVL